MKSKIIESQIKIYRENFLSHGDSPQGTRQNNLETQYLRYMKLIEPFYPLAQYFTIHDVGSGLCDLHKFLKEHSIQHEFSGTEIIPEMIRLSMEKYPYIKINNRDFLAKASDEQYDIVVLSGTLNMSGETPHVDWQDFSLQLIKKMFESSRWGISFNLLSSYRTFTDDTLYYFNPLEILDYCIKNLSRFVIIGHHYPLYEFTVTVFQKDFIQQRYCQDAFKKYFK